MFYWPIGGAIGALVARAIRSARLKRLLRIKPPLELPPITEIPGARKPLAVLPEVAEARKMLN